MINMAKRRRKVMEGGAAEGKKGRMAMIKGGRFRQAGGERPQRCRLKGRDRVLGAWHAMYRSSYVRHAVLGDALDEYRSTRHVQQVCRCVGVGKEAEKKRRHQRKNRGTLLTPWTSMGSS